MVLAHHANLATTNGEHKSAFQVNCQIKGNLWSNAMEWPAELTHGRVLLLLRPMVVDDGGDCQLARLLASHLLALSILRGGGGGGGRQ